MIKVGGPSISASDVEAVSEVLLSGSLTRGGVVREFENAVATYVGANHCVAFSSGSAALHSALVAADVGPGDCVGTSPMSFVASASCARHVGADVTFVDISPTSLNIDLQVVPAVDCLIPIHYAGLPCDLTLLDSFPVS